MHLLLGRTRVTRDKQNDIKHKKHTACENVNSITSQKYRCSIFLHRYFESNTPQQAVGYSTLAAFAKWINAFAWLIALGNNQSACFIISMETLSSAFP